MVWHFVCKYADKRPESELYTLSCERNNSAVKGTGRKTRIEMQAKQTYRQRQKWIRQLKHTGEGRQ